MHTLPRQRTYCFRRQGIIMPSEGITVTIGLILLILTGALVLFGAGQRALDRLRLTDRQALLFIALILVGGLLPDIPVTDRFSFNIGGALIPLILCGTLWAKADSWFERLRSLLAAFVTAAAVFTVGRLLPAEPEAMPFDVNYLYGIVAGTVGWLFGRSRRAAFIAGVLGTVLAHLASAGLVWADGVNQRLVLGGAGGFDVIVISGLLAVLLCELFGEIAERIVRGNRPPERTLRNGEFIRREARR